MGATELTFLLIAASFGFSFLVILVVTFLIKRKFSPNIKIDDPVRGVLEVTAASQPSTGAVYQNFQITGVIHVEGRPAQAVSHHGLVKTVQHPTPGMELPVTVSASDLTKFRIEWDQMLGSDERGMLAAEERARQINAAQQQQSNDNTW